MAAYFYLTKIKGDIKVKIWQYQMEVIAMSMPVINTNERAICRTQALTDLMESIALQETALSHIINAEGEKIQKILSLCNVNAQIMLQFNESVTQMIESVTNLELVLHSKLDLVTCHICDTAERSE